MSKGIGNKSTWVLIMLVLIRAVLGSFIGNLADGSVHGFSSVISEFCRSRRRQPAFPPQPR